MIKPKLTPKNAPTTVGVPRAEITKRNPSNQMAAQAKMKGHHVAVTKKTRVKP